MKDEAAPIEGAPVPAEEWRQRFPHALALFGYNVPPAAYAPPAPDAEDNPQ